MAQTLVSLLEKHGGSLSLIMVVLPNEHKARYDMLKKIITQAGQSELSSVPIFSDKATYSAVPSQFVLRRTLTRDKILSSIALKVIIQINCKLGGAPWRIENPVLLSLWTLANTLRIYAVPHAYEDA